MTSSQSLDNKIANLNFSKIYDCYLNKIEKKNRTKSELDEIIEWFTGFKENQVQKITEQNLSLEEFFAQATIHPNADLITGSICGHRIEDITNPLTQNVRRLDKLVDELAKGHALEKILPK